MAKKEKQASRKLTFAKAIILKTIYEKIEGLEFLGVNIFEDCNVSITSYNDEHPNEKAIPLIKKTKIPDRLAALENAGYVKNIGRRVQNNSSVSNYKILFGEELLKSVFFARMPFLSEIYYEIYSKICKKMVLDKAVIEEQKNILKGEAKKNNSFFSIEEELNDEEDSYTKILLLRFIILYVAEIASFKNFSCKNISDYICEAAKIETNEANTTKIQKTLWDHFRAMKSFLFKVIKSGRTATYQIRTKEEVLTEILKCKEYSVYEAYRKKFPVDNFYEQSQEELNTFQSSANEPSAFNQTNPEEGGAKKKQKTSSLTFFPPPMQVFNSLSATQLCFDPSLEIDRESLNKELSKQSERRLAQQKRNQEHKAFTYTSSLRDKNKVTVYRCAILTKNPEDPQFTVVAKTQIEMGEAFLEFVGERKAFDLHSAYAIRYKEGVEDKIIDANECGNVASLINFSFTPNVEFRFIQGAVMVVALTNIMPGQILYANYNCMTSKLAKPLALNQYHAALTPERLYKKYASYYIFEQSLVENESFYKLNMAVLPSSFEAISFVKEIIDLPLLFIKGKPKPTESPDSYSFLPAYEINYLTLLMHSAYSGAVNQVKQLLELGADPNARAVSSHHTPLHYAILSRAKDEVKIEIIVALLIKGAALDAQDAKGRTIFHHCSSVSSLAVINYIFYLIDKKNFNLAKYFLCQDHDGLNVINYAIKKQNFHMLLVFLKEIKLIESKKSLDEAYSNALSNLRGEVNDFISHNRSEISEVLLELLQDYAYGIQTTNNLSFMA